MTGGRRKSKDGKRKKGQAKRKGAGEQMQDEDGQGPHVAGACATTLD